MSSIGLGTYLGNADAATDENYRKAIVRSVEKGVNVFDTAINYRFQRSERSIGQALRDLTESGRAARDEIVIATKAGFISFDGEMPRNPREYFMQNRRCRRWQSLHDASIPGTRDRSKFA